MDGVKVEAAKQKAKSKFKSAGKYLLTFLKWFVLAAVTGAVGGVVGALFHLSVEYVTGVRKAHSWIVFLLPVGGLVIAGLYKLSGKKDIGTNEILDAVRSPQGVPALLAPLIFVSTVITHLFGGSAGREGAALQLGGSIAGLIGKIARLDEKDMHIMTMCGMSAVFSALFGTPDNRRRFRARRYQRRSDLLCWSAPVCRLGVHGVFYIDSYGHRARRVYNLEYSRLFAQELPAHRPAFRNMRSAEHRLLPRSARHS